MDGSDKNGENAKNPDTANANHKGSVKVDRPKVTRKPPAISPPEPSNAQQVHWLKRIFQALTLSNIIAFLALVIGVPAGLISWNVWNDRATAKREADEDLNRRERATLAQELQARVEQERLNREKAQDPSTSATAKGPEPAPAPQYLPMRETRIVIKDAPDGALVQAQTSRPFIYLKNVSLLKFNVGEPAVWDMILGNKGRPTEYTSTNWVGVVEFPKSGYTVPSCADTVKFGGKHSIVDEQHIHTNSVQSISKEDYATFDKGGYILSSSTFCYQDEATGKTYTSRVCVMKKKDGPVVSCPKE